MVSFVTCKLWSTADDLQLNRLARTILAVEQILERICARSFVFSGERLQHVAAGIEPAGIAALGFEATRNQILQISTCCGWNKRRARSIRMTTIRRSS